MVELYYLLKDSEESSLKSQMLDAAMSIPASIAEGSEFDSNDEFKKLLNTVKGTAAKLRTQVYITIKIKLLGKESATPLVKELKLISKMLQELSDSL